MLRVYWATFQRKSRNIPARTGALSREAPARCPVRASGGLRTPAAVLTKKGDGEGPKEAPGDVLAPRRHDQDPEHKDAHVTDLTSRLGAFRPHFPQGCQLSGQNAPLHATPPPNTPKNSLQSKVRGYFWKQSQSC